MPVNVPTGGFGLKLQIVDAFSQNLKKYGTAVGTAQMKTKGLRGAVERHAGAIRKMGMMTAVAGGVVTAAFALAVRTSGQFEQSMANVAAVAGATGDQLKKLSGFAREQARVTVFTASETADAMYYLASAGYGVEKMMKALPGVLALTAATGSDLSEVTSSVVATLNQFELQAGDAARVSNVFAAAIGKSQATMGKLGISMSYAGMQADALDMSLEQTTAILSKIYDLGIDASMAGTQFRMALIKLINPTKKTHTALKELGLTYEEVDPKIHNIVDSLELLGKKGMDIGQAVDIFGARAGATFFKLSKHTEGIDKLTESITGTNAAVEMSDKMINTWQGTLKLLKSAIQEVQLIIGDALLPVLTPMVKKFKEVVLRMGEWMKKNKGLTTALIKFGAVLGPVLIVLGGLMMILPSLVAVIPSLKIAILGLKVAFHSLLGPVGLAILAITAAVAAFIYFYKTNKGFKEFVDTKIVGGFKKIVSGLSFMIKNWSATWKAARQISDLTFEQIKKTVWKFFTDWSAFKAGLNLFAQFGKSLVMTWTKTWEMVGTILVRALSIVWAPLMKSLQWVADNIKYYFALGIEKARDALIKGINWITSMVFVPMGNFFIDVANKMTEGVQIFVNFFIRGMNTVTKAVKPVVDALSWFAKHILRIELPEAIEEFGEIAEMEFGKIERLGKEALAIKIPESTLKEPAKFAARMSEAWQIIKDQYSKIPGDLKKYVDDLVAEWEDVTKAAGEFGKAVDWSDYIGKLGDIITKLKAAGVNTAALEKEQNKLNESLNKTIGNFDYYTLLVAQLARELRKAQEDAIKFGWTFGKYDYAFYLLAARNAARDLVEEQKRVNEEATKLGWIMGKYDYALYFIAAQQAARDLVEEQKKLEEAAIKFGWAFGKYDYTIYLIAAKNAARDLQDEQKKLEEAHIKFGWAYGKYDYTFYLLAAARAARDLQAEQKKLYENAVKFGWVFGKYDYVFYLIAAKNAARDLQDEQKKLKEGHTKFGWAFGKYDYTFYLLAAKEAARDLNDEVKKVTESQIKLGWAIGKYDYTFYLIAARNAARNLQDEQKKLEENALKFGWAYGKFDYTMYLIEAQRAAGTLNTELKNTIKISEEMIAIWDSFTTSVKSSIADLLKDLIKGIKGGKEAWKKLWQEFGDVIVDAFIDAFARSLVEKMGFDKIFEGNILNLGNLFKGLGNLVVGVFKGIGNIIGGIFGGAGGALGGATVVAGQLAETGVAAEATATKMGIMTKIGLGLQSVVTGIGGALKYFATMGAGATTALGALASGLVGVAGFVGTAVAAWTGFSYLAENVIGPALSGIREGLNDFLGLSGSVVDSVEEMTNWFSRTSQAMAEMTDPAVVEAYKNMMVNMTRDVAAGIKQIGDMTHEESVKWLAEAIATNEHLTEEFKNTLLGILEASTESTEAITEKAKEAQVKAYDATTELYKKTQHLIEQGHNAMADAIAEAVVATEHAIESTTGATRKAFEQQLWDLQHLQNYGTEAYWRLYNEAKKSFEATAKEAKEANKDMSKSTKAATSEMAGTTNEATNSMTSSYNDLAREMAAEMNRMKNSGRTSTEDVRRFVELSSQRMAQTFGGSIQAMIDNMARIPTRIDFDVVGKLSMPVIPRLGTRYFDIVGKYKSAQKGITFVPHTMPVEVHRKEAILTAPQAEEWREGRKPGGEAGGNIEQNIGDIHITVEGSEVEDPTYWDRIFRNYINPALLRNAGRRTE